jgi:flagellar operon protein
MSAIDIESRILGTQPAPPPPAKALRPQPGTPRFDQVLADARAKANPQAGMDGANKAQIKFSGHAQTRLASRRITLTDSDMAKIGDAITKAAAKGARESLVLMDKAALVVSVPNRTVITAVARDDMKDNIFTNIDSALLI